MAFEQVVDAAIGLLRRRQRVTYRLLQREFGLDDQALTDLVNELVVGQRLARDENGQVLVWQDPHAAAPAERRQLTVMFCDLVGSTRLAASLDPEDLREVVHRYQAECAAVLRPLGGHIAQYLGDGLLVYFGYPQAHEDDAERAVRAGLAVVQAVRQLQAQLAARFRLELAVRVGIHTGLVVVGDVGGDERQETLALGEAPNLAAHIQAHAEPSTVLVSEDTARLLHQRYALEDHGEQPLKGSRPLRLLRVVGESQPGAGEPCSALVQRHEQVQHLQQAWQAAATGASHALLLRGDAGLGKTRLVDDLRMAVRHAEAEVVVLRCSAFHRHSALHPFAEQIARRAGLEADSPSDDVSERLGHLVEAAGLADAQALPLLAALVAPGSAPAFEAAALAPAQLMQATQQVLLDWLAAAVRRAPLLLVCEDLHWADASTLSLLKRLLEAPLPPRMLAVLTARPDFKPPWNASAHATLQLQPLPPEAMRELVQQLAAGRPLAAPLVERIVQVAEGVPLYAEEITKAVLESAQDQAAAIEVPATLQASLLARLDRLGPVKPLAQTAALLGREFSFELLASVVDLPVAQLGPALHQLVAADLLRRRGTPPQARYTFRHALLQSAAADSLLRSTRAQLHRRIAEALQTRFAAVVEAEPETLAHHLSEAGESLRAIPLWQRAGERALARSAVVEAVAHLEAGLSLLPAAPAGRARDRIELGLQLARASALRAVKGVAAPATGQAYEHAVTLARRLDDPAQLIPALNGLYSYRMVSGQCDQAAAPAHELLRVAHERGDAVYEMIGHRAVGAVAFHVGEPRSARQHLQQALAPYDAERHARLAVLLGIDHKVTASNFLSLTLFVLGEPEAALQCQREGLAHAERLDHAHSHAQALVFGCLLLALRGDWQQLPPWAERVIVLGQRRGFPLMEGGGRFFLGAARAFGGAGPQALRHGLAVMQQGSELWWGTGARNYRSYCELLMARATAALGQADAARGYLEAAQQGMAQTGERWAEPEMLRVQGELLHARDEAAGLRLLKQAQDVARRQGAEGWRQRAAASLAQLQAGAGTTTP
jgi:predicted ATPase/class 3 adenylate cyclase